MDKAGLGRCCHCVQGSSSLVHPLLFLVDSLSIPTGCIPCLVSAFTLEKWTVSSCKLMTAEDRFAKLKSKKLFASRNKQNKLTAPTGCFPFLPRCSFSVPAVQVPLGKQCRGMHLCVSKGHIISGTFKGT